MLCMLAVCRAYEKFNDNEPPIPIHIRLFERALNLILQENSFQFCHYLQTHGTAMGTKMAVAFANVFMAKVETEVLNQAH